jgi:hypothetical protein
MFVSGTGVSGLTPAAITYDRSIISVTINAGTASDTFHVTPAGGTSFTLNGGAPPPRALPGDTLDVNLAATTGVSNTDTLTAAGHEGSYTFTKRQAVNYTTIETLFAAGAPAVLASEFIFVKRPQTLRYTFNKPVSFGITALQLENLTFGLAIPPDAFTLSFDPTSTIASFTFPGYTSGILPDGDYRASLGAAAVSDVFNNHMTAGNLTNFFFLNGDLNRDRQVTISDFIDLSANFNKTNAIWTDGDLNYDGSVTISDFIDLAARFGASLGTPPPAAPQAAEAASITTTDTAPTLLIPRATRRRTHHHRH